MAKEFVKGVTVGEATAEENTQPTVSTVETNEEETKQVIRANEEDFIAGLIAAADFASDEEETQRVEIFRNGKLAFAFYIRPLGSEEYDKCRKKFTKYVRNKQLGIKMPEDELLLEANKWELSHGGLTGRTAQQFIDHLLGIQEE